MNDTPLAVLREATGGDFERIERLLMVLGHVNAADDFREVHKVVDAASEVLIAHLGDAAGRHARTALGCATLPNGNAVTLEVIAVLRPDSSWGQSLGTVTSDCPQRKCNGNAVTLEALAVLRPGGRD